MTTALMYLGGSTLLLIILGLFYSFEDRRGSRVLLVGLRGLVDSFLLSIQGFLSHTWDKFVTRFVKLLFHYGAHQLLKQVLQSVRRFESKIEEMLKRNKAVAREINGKKTHTHLDDIAAHKEESALTEEQKEALRSH